uniref:Olfactory receptor n=1 Tax=Sphenodon punctatus TaxID=8508 RepID=A0A8D0GWZ6_SPHPU
MENGTKYQDFILLGFTDNWKLQILIFVLLLFTYCLTITGNVLIIVITFTDHRLHTPMYFFLRNYAVLEIGYITAAIPKALTNLATGSKSISFLECMTQSFLYFFLGTTDLFLLTVMSFDRYVAICNPLHYTTIINDRVCILLVVGSWAIGFALIFSQTMLFIQFPFCGSNIIDHFFCDNQPLFKLLCGDTQLLQVTGFISAVFAVLGTLMVSIVSYGNIISTVLHIPSAVGRQKAFATCTSHITVVSIVYGTHIFMHVRPTESSSSELNKVVALLTSVVTPSLNPFIYTLRNEKVQQALREEIRWSQCST